MSDNQTTSPAPDANLPHGANNLGTEGQLEVYHDARENILTAPPTPSSSSMTTPLGTGQGNMVQTDLLSPQFNVPVPEANTTQQDNQVLTENDQNLEENNPTVSRAPPPSGTSTPIRNAQRGMLQIDLFFSRLNAPVPEDITDDEDNDEDYDEDDDEDSEDEWEVDTIPVAPPYCKSGSDSDDSDDDCDDDNICNICYHRKSTVSFPTCTHKMCPSCTKQYWWALLLDKNHWPMEIPCPFCRRMISAVVESDKTNVQLVRWIINSSTSALKRLRNANNHFAHPILMGVWIYGYRLETARSRNWTCCFLDFGFLLGILWAYNINLNNARESP
ncbi:hypothetical protein P167DRAFT_547066 [Morchella conica CCBAS932]|uniref:RING-type domain-containing protein n=1 Tax=Morchella conica CCBAS932 TaxID=1392247 RepID=A0A3N4KJP7_9PEZI|nr:hypothetical protein P167DRAFT_547066 [Morchella conica CCBAS932]